MLAAATGLSLSEIQNMTLSERETFIEIYNEKVNETKKD
jgi:hypothetical protein